MQDTREKKKSQSAGGKHDSHAIISPCEPERPVELEEEENKMAGTERRSQEDFEDTNAATSLVKLHLALESLIQHAEDRGDPSDVNVHECAELCAEWSRDDLSETFDTSLLHPVRSLAAVRQVPCAMHIAHRQAAHFHNNITRRDVEVCASFR